jgi:hypothetical protein
MKFLAGGMAMMGLLALGVRVVLIYLILEAVDPDRLLWVLFWPYAGFEAIGAFGRVLEMIGSVLKGD